jgi:glutathione S-transferase
MCKQLASAEFGRIYRIEPDTKGITMNARIETKMRLYSAVLSMFGAKVQIAALEKEIDFDLVMVPYDAVNGYSPKHPDVIRVNPKRQVPILINGDLEIFDSTQIFEYLEDLRPTPSLWPAEIGARACARCLEHQSDEVYFPNVIRLMGLQQDLQNPDAVAAIAAATRYYDLMEQLLVNNEFLAATFSYADIAFYMAQLFGERMGAPMTGATPRLLNWRPRLTARPTVRKVIAPMVDYLVSLKRPVPEFVKGISL